jgi:hypothetical protein
VAIRPQSDVFGIGAILILAVVVGCSKSHTNPEAVPPDAARAHPPSSLGRASVNGKGPSGTMVLLEPLFEHELPRPTGSTYMNQSGLAFIPEFLTAHVGQAVQFRNDEDVLHNVRVQETGTQVPVINVATTPYNTYSNTFEKAGFYDVSCDIHVSMRATILVSSTPYVSTADGAGQFAFADVIPGQYTVTWFEKGEQQHKQVDIRPPTTHVALP